MIGARWMFVPFAIAGCSADRGEALGRAPLALAPGFCIGNVVIDPATYHNAVPAEVLMTAEGAGPRTLNVAVSAGVQPQITYVGTRTPSHEDISKALGFSVTQLFQLTADSSVLVPVNAYARVAAYPAYEKMTWEVVGPDLTIWGSGSTLKPIGIYFDTCGCIGPDPCTANGCFPGPPFLPPDAGP
jgi:hypothetical protein